MPGWIVASAKRPNISAAQRRGYIDTMLHLSDKHCYPLSSISRRRRSEASRKSIHPHDMMEIAQPHPPWAAHPLKEYILALSLITIYPSLRLTQFLCVWRTSSRLICPTSFPIGSWYEGLLQFPVQDHELRWHKHNVPDPETTIEPFLTRSYISSIVSAFITSRTCWNRCCSKNSSLCSSSSSLNSLSSSTEAHRRESFSVTLYVTF
jgi:hypothetical protein